MNGAVYSASKRKKRKNRLRHLWKARQKSVRNPCPLNLKGWKLMTLKVKIQTTMSLRMTAAITKGWKRTESKILKTMNQEVRIQRSSDLTTMEQKAERTRLNLLKPAIPKNKTQKPMIQKPMIQKPMIRQTIAQRMKARKTSQITAVSLRRPLRI